MCCADFGVTATVGDVIEGFAIYFALAVPTLLLIWMGLKRIFKR